MTTIRFLLILFVLLDILVFAAMRGWFGFGQSPEGVESGRAAAQQLHPERIKVLGQIPPPDPSASTVNIQISKVSVSSPAAAGTASQPRTPPVPPRPDPAPAPVAPSAPAAPICLAWSGLTADQNSKLVSLLTAAGIQAGMRDAQTPTMWKVRVPPLPTREAAEILVGNMVELGIDESGIQIEELGPKKFAISLGLFRSSSNATRYLDMVKGKGVFNAEIEVRSTTERRVEATASQTRINAALAGQQAFAGRYKPCQS